MNTQEQGKKPNTLRLESTGHEVELVCNIKDNGKVITDDNSTKVENSKKSYCAFAID